MTPIQIGIVGCLCLLLLLTASLPVAFAMAVVGFVGFAVVVSPEAAMSMITMDLYDTFSSYGLTVIPLFVLMGQVAFHAGISRGLFNAAYHWLGALPGGLAMATVGACTAFGAICGSGPATSATMASVALPEMKRFKYSMELGCGAVAAGGGIGMLIPPSVVFIVYGIMTEQSVGKLFLAGVVPGILMTMLFIATVFLWTWNRPELAMPGARFSLREKIASLTGVVETLILFVAVMGGLFSGVFTPTEAAAVGAFGTLLIAVAGRHLSWNGFVQSLVETTRVTCMILVIVAGATVFGHFLAVTRIPFDVGTWVMGLQIHPWAVMSLILLVYLLLGCLMDALALIMLTIPIFYPVVVGLGYDPIWFGVIIVVVTMMGVISPPVGVCVYVVSGIERDVPLQTVFRGALPFLGALIVAAILLILFPQLCLFLPEAMR